ncbi:putative transporter [Aspergillus saccharolyticus JOP 1030-1]|uniref:Putative transporter n=1 Tax=Aspergillus saccharolyticus JOP 1030-1 TaxID=1450539 RepID=A0A318ZMF9_9EURO|nr:putative transporter [Aspergillus saccharolyticus JOP 1030-1]PYH48157.1 putative transporter [Aspergillus saccharolyticus JOP 1030-1]
MALSISGDNSGNSPFHIQPLSLLHEISMLITLICTQVLVMACLAQAIFAGGVITQDFATSCSQGNWGPAAYGLTSGAFMLPAGRIGDIYGHRQCYIGAWTGLSIASLLAGISVYSHSFIFYAITRGLQGMATAMLLPCALAILGSVYREGPRKNLVFSLFAAGSPTGFTLGGIFSGLLVELAWWPWIFWITAMISAGLSVIAYGTVPSAAHAASDADPQPDVTGPTFDWTGTLVGVSGLLLFNVAWNQAPSVGWNSATCITLATLGFVLILLFPFIERRAQQPLIPISRLSTESGFVLIVIALSWSSFGILTFYLTRFLTDIRHATPLNAAAQFIPVPIAGCIASYLNSFLLHRGASPVNVLAFSCIWFTVGAALLATLPIHQSFWVQVFWIQVLAPLGIDLSFPSATLLISELVPRNQLGVAASLIATTVYYSQSIGLGIAGTVEAYVADDELLQGYRGAAYTGIGLSGMGLVVALGAVLRACALGKSRESKEMVV